MKTSKAERRTRPATPATDWTCTVMVHEPAPTLNTDLRAALDAAAEWFDTTPLSERELVALMLEHQDADPHRDPVSFYRFHESRLRLQRLRRAAGR